MPGFKGKRKRGLTLTLYKKRFLYRFPNSPPTKRQKYKYSPYVMTPKFFKKSLSISKYLASSSKKNISSTPIRRTLFTVDQDRTDIQDVSFKSISVVENSHMEVDETKYLDFEVEEIHEVLERLSNVEKKDKFLKFVRLVKNGKFPLNNIAFELFLDTVEWFDKDESRRMRYSPSALQFFWLGRKLFGNRFIRFMSGPKNESDILSGETASLDPSNARINFACPNELILREINPLGGDFPIRFPTGLIEPMIQLKAENSSPQTSYVLMFDGKKVRKGGDVDLLGFDDGQTLAERKEVHAQDIGKLTALLELAKKMVTVESLVNKTRLHERESVNETLKICFDVISRNIKELREFKKRKDSTLRRLKDLTLKDPGKSSSFAYAIDLCRTVLYRVENCLSSLLEVQRTFCKTGAVINGVEHLFAHGNIVNLNLQSNVKLLKTPEEMKEHLKVSVVPPPFIKQRTQEWMNARKRAKVTGSTIYSAIGCDSLKKQKQHFDKVISGIETDAPNQDQREAMLHGTESEVHEVATLASIIMPFLFPDLIFHEEGYYVYNDIVVSPDGSLRSSNGVAFAFEGKAPMGNVFTTPVHYKVPSRYITQTLFEQKVLSANFGTLYLSWSTESTTAFIVPGDEILCRNVESIIDSVYNVQVPKRPVKTSQETKNVKSKIENYVDKCVYLGEFPSVKGCENNEENGQLMTGMGEKKDMRYDELIRAILNAKKTVDESYDLRRNYASQVVVFLLADLDRLWKPEEPHAVPILYFFRGYSLSMDVARQILDFCKNKCIENGLDVVVSSSDGEFLPLMVKSKNGTPLTLHQLNKSVWNEVCKKQKSEIIQIFRKLNRSPMFLKVDSCIAVVSANPDEAKIITPSNGWKTKKDKLDTDRFHLTEESDVMSNVQDGDTLDDEVIIHEEVIGETLSLDDETDERSERNKNMQVTNLSTDNFDRGNIFDEENIEVSDQLNSTSGICDRQDQTSPILNLNNPYTFTPTDYSDILYLLRLQNDRKWGNKDRQNIADLLSSTEKMNGLLKPELLEITQFLAVKLKGKGDNFDIGQKMTKIDLINQLSDKLGYENHLEKKKRKKPSKSPKLLQDLAANELNKKGYPKQVLNIAYATYVWPSKVKEWREKSHVAPKVTVECDGYCRTFEPYYVPEFIEERQDFELFIYDKTHLATNMRKCVCLDKVDGVSIKAWEKVSKKSPDILNRSVIEVSTDGKILDQMKEHLSRTMFSSKVEDVMRLNGDLKEARFCNVIREALFIADDKPGIPAALRCEKRLNLMDWLAEDVNFGHFPPYGARIKGLSHILYEGLRSSMEGKLYLYAISKAGTYCARAPSTLCSESFFSTMQEMDPWGQGILTTSGVEKHISDFTTITAMKMKEDRNIYIQTRKDTAYPVVKLCQPQEDSSDEQHQTTVCHCRSSKMISCIMPKDHFFDSNERARLTKEDEHIYQPQPISKPARGEQPIRQQFGYRINEAKLLPSQRMGLELPTMDI